MQANHPPTSRRRFGVVMAAACLALAGTLPAVSSAAYPDKPIRLVVPYPPGGATDVIGRIVAQGLTDALKQTVVVENRSGATGNIGAAAVANAQPDGYTLLLGALTSHSINAALYGSEKVLYDLEKGFSPVGIVGRVPLVFVVNPSVKAKNLTELIALAKASPGSLTYASSGNGSPQHLAGELFKGMAKVDILHVPYRGSGPAMTDLIGGQVLMMIETAPAALPHIKGDKLRPLAAATATRVPTLPDVPTAAEAGLPGFEVSSMFGVLAPAGTPEAAVNTISTALKDVLAQKSVQEALLQQGVIAGYAGPADAGAEIKREVGRWRDVIKQGGIKGD